MTTDEEILCPIHKVKLHPYTCSDLEPQWWCRACRDDWKKSGEVYRTDTTVTPETWSSLDLRRWKLARENERKEALADCADSHDDMLEEKEKEIQALKDGYDNLLDEANILFYQKEDVTDEWMKEKERADKAEAERDTFRYERDSYSAELATLKQFRTPSEMEVFNLICEKNKLKEKITSLENALREIAVCDHWLGRIAKKALHEVDS